jgi:hypothetical protein
MRKNNIYIRGKEYKNRPIDLVLKKLLEIQEKKYNFRKLKWDPWWKDSEPIKKFWGTELQHYQGKPKPKKVQIVFEFSVDGVSFMAISKDDLKTQALIISDSKIPLVMFDPVWKEEALSILEGRLKGTIKQMPHRQDLVDRYNAFNIRDRHIYTALEMCRDLLFKYIRDKYSDKIYSKIAPTKLFVIKNNGHVFYIANDRDLHLLEGDDVKELNIYGSEPC